MIHARHKESDIIHRAAIAQLGERQTEDLKVPGSGPTVELSVAQRAESRNTKEI